MTERLNTGRMQQLSRPWWLLVSFGLAFSVYAAFALFLGGSVATAVRYLWSDGAWTENYCVGLLIAAAMPAATWLLASVVQTEVQSVFGNDQTAATTQAKVWEQGRYGIVAVSGLLAAALVVVPGPRTPETFGTILALLGMYTLCIYLNAAHKDWAALIGPPE